MSNLLLMVFAGTLLIPMVLDIGWPGITPVCCWDVGWARTLQKGILDMATLFYRV